MLFPRKILSFPLLRCADLFLVDISGKKIWWGDWTGCKYSTFTFAHSRKVHLSPLTPISSKRPCWCFSQGCRCCLILLGAGRAEEQFSSFWWRKGCWVSQGRDRWAWGMSYNGGRGIWSNCLEGKEHFIFRGHLCCEDQSLAAPSVVVQGNNGIGSHSCFCFSYHSQWVQDGPNSAAATFLPG